MHPRAFRCLLFLTTVFSAALKFLLALSAITDSISKREGHMNQIYLLRFFYFYLSLSKYDVGKKQLREKQVQLTEWCIFGYIPLLSFIT